MTRVLVAIPASILFLSLSMPAASQSLVEDPSPPVAKHLPQGQPPSPAQSSVIEVRPDLSDEQLADVYMARKEYREASVIYKRLADQNPQNPVYLNKMGMSLHQQTALGAAFEYYQRRARIE